MDNVEKKSLLCQTIATAGLIQQLAETNFLNSDYYRSLTFDGLGTDGKILKGILNQSGIGNPATMLMYLYGLLVMPKELFKTNSQVDGVLKDTTNQFLSSCAVVLESTYQSDNPAFNYYRHLRNAVSHALYSFESPNNTSYTIFCDENSRTAERCKFRVNTEDMGILLSKIQYKLIELYNEL